MDTQAFDSSYLIKRDRLQKDFKERIDDHHQVALKKNTSNLFRHRSQQKRALDVRSFNRVIKIDKENKVAEVEGMITYADLVDATLEYDCLPTVVPELKSITIGGALSGIGIESSSFRYGLVHETIKEIDVLTGSGDIITCHPNNEYKDLFFGFPNSYGTLGYALKIKVKLIPVKPYVELTHHKFTDPKAYYQTMEDICLKNRDNGDTAYIDGTVFNENEMYITEGKFVDEAPYISNYNYMKIYYRSIKKKKTDYLTAKDYIWRWDADWFWCSKVFYMQNPLLRLLFGKFMLNSVSYWKIKNLFNRNRFLKFMNHHLSKRKESVIQDVAIPIDKAVDFFNFFHKEIGIKPFWNCPLKSYDSAMKFDLFQMDPYQFYVNFGFWDMIPSDKPEGYYNRLIEDKVRELGGIKSLYSNVYYSEEEFWKIFDKNHYDSLKSKYDPHQNLKNLYQKCIEKSSSGDSK